jgi:hypothetical protein
MSRRFAGEGVVVTGAASGMGRAIALALPVKRALVSAFCDWRSCSRDVLSWTAPVPAQLCLIWLPQVRLWIYLRRKSFCEAMSTARVPRCVRPVAHRLMAASLMKCRSFYSIRQLVLSSGRLGSVLQDQAAIIISIAKVLR